MTSYTPEAQWNAYMAAFGTDMSPERDRLLAQSVADNVVFTNPGATGTGRAALSDHIAHFRAHMPGMVFETDKVYVSSGELLAVWTMYKGGHVHVATGYNFVRLDETGRFSYMAGFF